jgi:hypothetical protein
MTKQAYVSTREILTADGRNLAGEAWRTIPEFPKYQITKDGDIRNFRTNRILVETEHGTTGAFYYTLWKNNGKTYNRSYLKLLHSAWPELQEGWDDIPEFPGYQVNEAGQVRSKRWPDKLLPRTKSGAYRLTRDGKRHPWRPEQEAACSQQFADK